MPTVSEDSLATEARYLRQLLNLMKQRYHAISRQLHGGSDVEHVMLAAGVGGWWDELMLLENSIERLEKQA